jgi:hypothetical protein
MNESDRLETEIDLRILVRITATTAVFLAAFAVVNALTLLRDAERSGVTLNSYEPWLLELTSAAITTLLVPLIALVERYFPIGPERRLATLAVHLMTTLGFCALHVAGMVALRKLLFAVIFGQNYVFFEDPIADLGYEYRKDLMTYLLVVVVTTLLRANEEQRRDLVAAKDEARASGRLTLKSGGSLIMLDAEDVEWARAAANYVEVRAAGRAHLVRATLTSIEGQLSSAGADVVRIHRSHVVNRARIVEVRPDRDGSFTVRMTDGTQLPCSRRYRASIEKHR